jgi:hypothetical protein
MTINVIMVGYDIYDCFTMEHFRLRQRMTLTTKIYCSRLYIHTFFCFYLPGDQEGLFKLAVQLRKFFNSVIYNTATGYVLLVYLTNI